MTRISSRLWAEVGSHQAATVHEGGSGQRRVMNAAHATKPLGSLKILVRRWSAVGFFK